MIAHGAGPDRSAFLSAFFALVGMHGLHVSIGLAWLVSMVAPVFTLGWRPVVIDRGEAEVSKGQLPQGLERVVDRDVARAHALEELADEAGIHRAGVARVSMDGN